MIFGFQRCFTRSKDEQLFAQPRTHEAASSLQQIQHWQAFPGSGTGPGTGPLDLDLDLDLDLFWAWV